MREALLNKLVTQDVGTGVRVRSRTRSERGALGGIEGMAFGILIFVFGTLIVVYGWSVIDAKIAATAAAREASRAYVEAPNAEQASVAAEEAASQTLAGHNRTLIALDIPNNSFQRCTVVEVSVTTRVHRVSIPLLHQLAGDTDVTGRHTENIDPYRSGLAGVATC